MKTPALSAVVITPDSIRTVEAVLRQLHAQDCHAEIEILLCAPTLECAGPEQPFWSDFAAFRILETGDLHIIAEAKALAVRNAAAPVVVFCEEHCFPARGWGRALIERHKENHAVVGPVFVNPNPRLPISWANFVIEYGPWLAPSSAGSRHHLPGNNSSYKRDVLQAFGDQLAAKLDAETLLHWELNAAGHSLYLEPKAIARHVNITRLDSFRSVHYQYGRMFAAQRRQNWPAPKRIIYAALSPLIPLIRLKRHWPDIQRNPKVPRGKPAFWGYLMLALLDSARGEAVGYVAGPGDSREHVFDLEFHRLDHLDPADPVNTLFPSEGGAPTAE